LRRAPTARGFALVAPFALVALVPFLPACGGAAPAPPPIAAPPALHVSPVADLVPAAHLSWLVLARPREVASRVDLIPAVHELVSEERLAAFAKRNAVDVRAVDELAVARYAESTLYIARTRIDPLRVEAAFTAHLREVAGRAIDRHEGADGQIVRTWGEAGGETEQLAILGTAAVALEQGKLGTVRVVELFAEQRLKKAAPARRTPLLARAAALVGDAPLLAFAPGPFDDGRGLGGLLAATTAVAIAVRFPAPPPSRGGPAVTPAEVTIALLGAWKDDGPAAAERLLAVYGTLSGSSLGALCGLDHPLGAARARSEADAIVLDVTLDALAVTRGLHAAVDAQVDEIMRYGTPQAPAPLTPVP
jgi:hypothetical protein